MKRRDTLKHFEFYSGIAATLAIFCFIIAGIISENGTLSSIAYANVAEPTPTETVEETHEETEQVLETVEIEIEGEEDADTGTVEEGTSEFETVEQGEVEQNETVVEVSAPAFSTYVVSTASNYVVSVYDEPNYDSEVIGYVSTDDVLMGYEYDESFIEFNVGEDFAYISLDSVEEYVVELQPVNQDMDTADYFTLYTSINSESGLTEDEIAYLLEGSYMEGYEYLYYNAEKIHGINAYFMLAVSQLESGWGRSEAGLYSNNLFGIMTGSGNIRYFNSKDECCEYWVNLITESYINRGNDTPAEIGPIYCSWYWSEVICDYMNDLAAIVDRYKST